MLKKQEAVQSFHFKFNFLCRWVRVGRVENKEKNHIANNVLYVALSS